MQITFRLLTFAIIGIGLIVGVSFGLGVAYGKGDSLETNNGLTEQQIQALIGGSGAGGAGQAQRAGAPGASGTAGPGGGTAPGGGTTGQITAVEGQSMTVQTAQGSVKVSVGENTVVQTLAAGQVSDFKVGDSVMVVGNRDAEGNVTATSVTEVAGFGQGPQTTPRPR